MHGRNNRQCELIHKPLPDCTQLNLPTRAWLGWGPSYYVLLLKSATLHTTLANRFRGQVHLNEALRMCNVLIRREGYRLMAAWKCSKLGLKNVRGFFIPFVYHNYLLPKQYAGLPVPRSEETTAC